MSSNIQDVPIHTNQPIRVIIIGAGASGLLMGYKIQRNFDDVQIQIYEKNPEVGGTWYENRYPGCACDNPAHTYVWSFDPNPQWSSAYASSAEIHDYFKRFQFKFNLGNYTKAAHQVTGASWHADEGRWHVDIQGPTGNIIHDSCEVLINAGGILNAWRWPAIPGLKNFKGPLVHSAAWDKDLDLTGKHAGLIGNGSSGIQILPAILPIVSRCTTFIREPTWVAVGGFAGFQPRLFSDKEKAEFANDTGYLLRFRKWLEHNANKTFPLFMDGSDAQKGTRGAFDAAMKEKLRNKYLEEKLIPEWAVGCRRLTPGIGYLESLGDEKTEVVYGEISSISEAGCITEDGKEHPVDVLICATGFDTTFKPRFPLKGSAGRLLSDDWKDEPRSYLGVAAAGYPNYFMFLGPNSPIGNGPVLVGIEAQADYFCKILRRIQQEQIKSIEVKSAAVDDFIAHKDNFMKRTVWEQDCRSWYKGNTVGGKIVALWVGSTLHYMDTLKEIRYEDYNIEYRGNRFDYLGNGLAKIETYPDADLSTYIRNFDDGPILGSKKDYARVASETTAMNFTAPDQADPLAATRAHL